MNKNKQSKFARIGAAVLAIIITLSTLTGVLMTVANAAERTPYYGSTCEEINQSIFFDEFDLDATTLTIDQNIASMTEPTEITVTIDQFTFPSGVANFDDIEWNIVYGGKPLTEWKKWVNDKEGYIGEPFITVSQPPVYDPDSQTVTLKLNFDLVFAELTDLYTSSASTDNRVNALELRGVRELTVEHGIPGQIVSRSAPILLNPYKSFHTYEEILKVIERTIPLTSDDRYMTYQTVGTTPENRDINIAVLARDEDSVTKYLNVDLPKALSDPASVIKEIEAMSEEELKDVKIPIWLNNVHPNEMPGIDAMLDLIQLMATEDEITYADYADTSVTEKVLDKKVLYKTYPQLNQLIEGSETQDAALNIQDVLDHFIVIFNFTSNPDGMAAMQRTNSNGIDLNRDWANQSQAETAIIGGQISKWMPLSMIDLHGYYPSFLLEPCTPPHDPNMEFDLLIDNMLMQAHEMGLAGMANSGYENYEIPYEDRKDGFDDISPTFTSVYSMFCGSMGHTVEIPESNQKSVNAAFGACLGALDYCTANKKDLYLDQLEIFRRGVDNEDAAELIDPYLVDKDFEPVGRPRGEFDNFFPEYYILPIDETMQKNSYEVYQMVQYLLRNRVEVERLVVDTLLDGVIYPKGSFVVNMHQAKRGFANTVLFRGLDASDYTKPYSKFLTAFPELRGFDCYEIREPDAFTDKTISLDLASYQIPPTHIPSDAETYIIKNTNNDAIRAVNALLSEGEIVSMVLTDGADYRAGDFAVSREALNSVRTRFLLDVTAGEEEMSVKDLVKPVLATLYNDADLVFMLKNLGFETQKNFEEDVTNCIATMDSADFSEQLDAGIPLIGLDYRPMETFSDLGLTDYEAYTARSREGLFRGNYTRSLLTGWFPEQETIYNSGGYYFTKIPENATVLTQVSDEDSYYIAGWWPDLPNSPASDVQGKPIAISFEYGENGAPVTLFANRMNLNGHPQKDWRMLANAIFTSVSDITEADRITASLEAVEAEQAGVALKTGEVKTLSPVFSPANATNKALTWESSDSEIAVVSGGLVYGVKEGSTTVTATSSDGEFTASYPVSVSAESVSDVSVLLQDVGLISGKQGTQFSVPVKLSNFPTGSDCRALQTVIQLPSPFVTVDVTASAQLSGLKFDYKQTGDLLRVAFVSLDENPIRFDPSSDEPIFTLRVLLDGNMEKDETAQIKVESFIARTSLESVEYDVENAVSTIQSAGSGTEVTATLREMYRGDNVDLIHSTKKAVAVEFTGITEGKDITLHGKPLYFSPEKTKQSGKITYVAYLDIDVDFNLIDANTFTYSNNAAQTLKFGDIDKNNTLNAQDALAITRAWLRKDAAPSEEMILIMNVSGDSRIDTGDAVLLVESYLSGKAFPIVSK